MTDAELKKLAIEHSLEPTYELLHFGRMAIMKSRIDELKMWESNIRAAVAKEREACALVAESYEPRCDTCPSGVANAIRGRK